MKHIHSARSTYLSLGCICAVAATAFSAPDIPTNGYWKTRPTAVQLPEAPYRIALFNPPDGVDQARAWSQTQSTFLYGFGVIGILVAMPESMTGWEKDPDILNKWFDHVTGGPEWDRNDWAYNYLGHTYFGGVYYQVARKSGHRQWDSFIYALMMSTFYWEYGIEAFAEVPSIQDLVVTPIMGWVYGEWAYQTEAKIRDRGNTLFGSKTLGNATLFFLDPVDLLGRSLNRLTGRNLIRAGYGYFTYTAAPRKGATDHQIYLHMIIPIGPAGPAENPPVKYEHRTDPVDTGVVGISIGTAAMRLDGRRNIENGTCTTVTLGLYFTPRWSLRLTYAQGDFNDPSAGQNIRYENYRIDAQCYLNKDQRLRPYLTAGGGEQMWAKDETRATHQLNGGLGLHWRLHRKWALQTEWVNLYSPSQKTRDRQINLQLVYRFGRGEHEDW